MVENRRYPIYSGICMCNGLQSFCLVDTVFSTIPTYYQGGSRRYLGIKALFKVLRYLTHYYGYGRGYNSLKHHFGCLGNVV